MRGLWGWFAKEAAPEDKAEWVLESMGQGSAGGTPGVIAPGAAVAGHRSDQVHVWNAPGILAVIVGGAYWDSAPLDRATLPRLVETYRQSGIKILDQVRGAFVLAIWDSVHREGLLATDRYGTYSLCYAEADRALVFGPTPAEVAAHPAIITEVDPQALFNYVYFHMIPAPATVYRDVRRMPPGQVLRYRRGRLDVIPYWHYTFDEQARCPRNKLEQALRATLRNAVARAAEGATGVGAFLSGGTDSSAIAGLLGEVTGRPARTYSIGFKTEGYDETEYARSAARHFGTDHHEYYMTSKDLIDAIPKVVHTYGQPYGNASAVPTYYCARLAREDGVERLLGGDGGDELFGGNARYAKQWKLSLYEHIPRSLRKGLIEPTLSIPGVRQLPGASKLRRYVEQASIPMPARMESYNLLGQLGPAQVFTHDFLANVDMDAPIRHITGLYGQIAAGNQINRMLGLDLRITLADNDLPKVSGMCDAAGIDARFPMLDEAVGEFAARLPPDLKVKRTHLRYLYKKALAEFLPKSAITKRKHGFGVPFGPWLKQAPVLREMVGDSLSQLHRRGLLRRQFVDGQVDQMLEIHAPYYGTLIWVLVMLEAWLDHHEAQAPRAKVRDRVV